MKKFEARVKCSCGNDTFSLKQNISGTNKTEVAMQATLCHDGFGWDMNDFTFRCTQCGENEIENQNLRVDLQEINR